MPSNTKKIYFYLQDYENLKKKIFTNISKEKIKILKEMLQVKEISDSNITEDFIEKLKLSYPPSEKIKPGRKKNTNTIVKKKLHQILLFHQN